MSEATLLLDLQEHDLQAARLNKQLDELPEKRAILAARAKIAEIEQLGSRTDAVLHAVDAALKRVEDEMSAVNGTIETEQAKLLSGQIKAPKELQAISLELSALKRKLEKLESDALSHMAKRDAAAEQSAKIAAAVKVGKAREAEMVESFKAHGGELVGQISHLEKERRALLAQLSAPVRDLYEKVRESHHGIAVGVLEGSMCSACRVTIPHGPMDALLAGPDVTACPTCRRMLIVRKG